MDTENQKDNPQSVYNKIYYLFLGGFIISLIFIVFFLNANTKKNIPFTGNKSEIESNILP